MGDDIPELIRLRRLKKNLELPAYLFERYGRGCVGLCESPVAISPTLPAALTCCNLRQSWDRYNELHELERALAARIQTAMDRTEEVEAPLAARYPRTFKKGDIRLVAPLVAGLAATIMGATALDVDDYLGTDKNITTTEVATYILHT